MEAAGAVRKRAAFTIVLGLLCFSVLRGIRFPNIWSHSHFLFNYDYGFTKRGLMGAVVGGLGVSDSSSYELFFLFSLIVLIANVVLMALLMRDFVVWGGRLGLFSSLLFASSMALVFLAHTVGYFDHLGLLVALVALRIPAPRGRALFLALSLPPLLLIHEAMLVVFVPLMLVSLVLLLDTNPEPRKLAAIAGVTVLALTSVYLTTRPPLETPQVEAMFQAAQSKVDHPLRRDAFAVLERTASANIEYMRQQRATDSYRERMRDSLWVTAPTFLVFVAVTIMVLHAAGRGRLVLVLSAAASLSTLSLHYIAADLHRWNSLAITTSFLMLFVACKASKDAIDWDAYERYAMAMTPLIFINTLSSIELFDGFVVKNLPFSEHFEYLGKLATGESSLPQVPPR